MEPKLFLDTFLPHTDKEEPTNFTLAERVTKYVARALYVSLQDASEILQKNHYQNYEYKGQKYIKILSSNGQELYWLRTRLPKKNMNTELRANLREKQIRYFDMRRM